MFEEIFAKKKICPPKLLEYGFEKISNEYRMTRAIMDGDFLLSINFDGNGNVDTALTECSTGEEYLLYKTTAQGTYVGKVREAVSEVLSDIVDKCFESSVFKQPQTLSLIDYAMATYGDHPEFLWKSTPNNAILRRKDSGKWYGAILTIPKCKLGFDSKQLVEIIDLHATPDTIEQLLKRPHFYTGWHMNKKSWYTVILDGSLENDELYALLSESYRLAVKNPKTLKGD